MRVSESPAGGASVANWLKATCKVLYNMILDEINVMILMDQFMVDAMEPFRPHYNTHELDTIYKMTGNIYMSKPIVAAMTEYYQDENE